jgi:hypothetical protein
MPLAGRRERLAGSFTDGASIATAYSNVAGADVIRRSSSMLSLVGPTRPTLTPCRRHQDRQRV